MPKKRKAKPARRSPKKPARLSKKEQARRAKISKALKAYHRKARQRTVAKPVTSVAAPPTPVPGLLDMLRRVVGAVPITPGPLPILDVERAVVPGAWRAGPRLGEQAFGLRDNADDAGFNVDAFIGRESVTADITIARKIDDGQRMDERKVIIEFEGGEDETEFWDNYHEAVREAIDASWDDFEADYPDYDRDDEGSAGGSVAVVAVA